ncbi:acyltransferase family protein [Vibrio fluvialis]|nr:acyltransferase family protein [Vibrio fluvialis]
MSTRNNAFDATKGFLILLVILGHVLLGSIDKNLDREIIYFFHMPLFLAITGFFISEQVTSSSIREICSKYYARLIVPFLIAFIFYTSLKFFTHELEVKSIVSSILYPYYHLWYVPAMLLFIIYTKYINVLRGKNLTLFNIVLIVCATTTVFFESYGQNISNEIIYKLLGDKRFYYFYSYFYLGYLLSKTKRSLPTEVLITLLTLSVMLYSYAQSSLVIGLGKVIANASLICIVINILQNSTNYTSMFLAKIGQVSLPIYLWHIAPIIILKKLNLSNDVYYLSSMLTFSVFIIMAIQVKGKSRLIDKYFYGIQHA